MKDKVASAVAKEELQHTGEAEEPRTTVVVVAAVVVADVGREQGGIAIELKGTELKIETVGN